jgi:hypothetical protein
MMKKIVPFSIFLFSALNLASCGVYSSKFNSAPAAGVYNKSLDEVDALIDAGILDDIWLNQKTGKDRLKVNDRDIVFSPESRD